MSDWTLVTPEEEAQLTKQKPVAPGKERSLWTRFTDSLQEGADTSMVGAAVRKFVDWTDYGLPAGAKNWTEEQKDELIRQAARAQRAEHARKREADPILRDRGVGGTAAHGAVDLLGSIVGGADPTYIIAPGKNVVQRIGSQMAVNAGADAVTQGLDIADGVQDEYDVSRTGVNALAGGTFQAVGEAAAKGAKAVKERFKAPKENTDWEPLEVEVHDDSDWEPVPFERKEGGSGRLPVQGTISSGFGARKSPKAGASTNHGGIDIRAAVGTPVEAPGSGRVVNVGTGGKRGNWIEVAHDNGLVSRYFHLQDFKVGKGDTISAGQIIGRSGRTGNVTGAHLHWSVLKDGKPINPLKADFGPSTKWEEVGPSDRSLDDAAYEASANVSEMEDLAPSSEAVAEFAENRAIADYAQENNLDQVDVSHDYLLRSDAFPDLKKEIERRTQQVINDTESGPRRRADDEPLPEAPELKTLPEPAVSPNKLFNEVSRDADGNIHLEYGSDKIPVKIGIDDGKAEIAVNQFGTGANRIGPVKIREALQELKAMYPEIKSIGGYRKSGANPGRVQEINLDDKLDLDHLRTSNVVDGGGKQPPSDPPEPPRNDSGGDGDPPEFTPEISETIAKLNAAVRDARPIRDRQERANKRERARRANEVSQTMQYTEGEAGFYAQLGKLKGSFDKVDFDPIRDQFGQKEIDNLVNLVQDSSRLDVYDKVKAQGALLKLLGSEGGAVPTNSELKLLSEIFPKDMIDNLLNNRDATKKMWDKMISGLGIPRAVMSSADLSAPLRQGLPLIHRKEYWASFLGMFRAFGSKKYFDAIQDEIVSRPSYKQMKRAGLSLTGVSRFLEEREEDFISDLAEKIPVYGRVIKASNQAYVGFLNKLRADTFDTLVKNGEQLGINFKENPKALKDIASYINAASGRGSLGKYTAAAPALSAMFFSPRLVMSRLTMLNPIWYARLDPFARKEAMKSLLAMSSVALTALTLASMFGAEVEQDPRSADFAKIKTGDTRYDILGGFQQYIRLGAQLITGQKKNGSGEIKNLGEGFGSDSRRDVLVNFGISKLSPIASFISDMLEGKDFKGEKVELDEAVKTRVTPMIAQGISEAVEEYGAAGLLTGIPSLFGVGVNTYDSTGSKELDKPKEPGRELTFDGEKRRLSDEEFDAYTKLSAEKYKTLYDENIFDFADDLPVKQKKETAKRLLSKARREAKKELFEQEWQPLDAEESTEWEVLK